MHETHAENIRINLNAFGPATIRRFYTHKDVKPVELVADVITDRGEIMHLSIAYVNKLMTSQGLPSVLN